MGHRLVEAVKVFFEHVLDDDPASGAQQLFEQRRFPPRKIQLRSRYRRHTRGRIEGEAAAGVDDFGARPRSPQHRPQPRLELDQREGLDQIVVSAAVQSPHAIVDRVAAVTMTAGSAPSERAQFVANTCHAVDVGQAEVQDDRVIGSNRGGLDRLLAPLERVDREAPSRQVITDHLPQGRVVLEQQHSHQGLDAGAIITER